MFTKIFAGFCIVFMFVGCSSREYVYQNSRASVGTRVQNPSQIKDSANMHRATMRPYTVLGKTYYPTTVSIDDSFSGIASWYGKDFHNKKTSNGEYYNMYAMTAAHKTLPMNTMLRVTNVKNNRQIIVRINDRGPFVRTRIIDLSYAAASKLDIISSGTAPVRLEVLGFGGTIDTVKKPQSIVMDGYLVQIGAFRNKNGALSYIQKYASVDGRYNAVLQEGQKDGVALYRVFLKGFKSEFEARDFIAKSDFSGAFIARQ